MGWEGRRGQWAVLEPEETLGHKQIAHTLFFFFARDHNISWAGEGGRQTKASQGMLGE